MEIYSPAKLETRKLSFSEVMKSAWQHLKDNIEIFHNSIDDLLVPDDEVHDDGRGL